MSHGSSSVTVYLAAISILAAGLTVYDKWAARHRARRIRERTLLLVALLGGSAVMLPTMLLIRHKTRHIRFMAGIPLILLLQAALFLLLMHMHQTVFFQYILLRRLSW